MENKKLTKSTNKVISGICGGIADFLDWPANKVRWLWALVTIFTGGTLILAYIVCVFIFPSPPKKFDLNQFRQQ